MQTPENPVIEKKHFNKVGLLDADYIKHHVCGEIYELLSQNYTREEIDIDEMIERKLLAIHNSFSCAALIFCFSGKSSQTFRYSVAVEKEYKGNRKQDSRDYEQKVSDIMYVVEYIMKSNNVLIFSDLEADDILSMLQCEETFIISNDKDLKQVPGWHFNFKTLNIHRINEIDAHKNLCYQLLVGDATDCIPGLKGIGDKRALEIMGETPMNQMIFTILLEYQKRYGINQGTDMFTETWNLVKLRENRGTYFKEKYSKAFLHLEACKQQIK